MITQNANIFSKAFICGVFQVKIQFEFNNSIKKEWNTFLSDYFISISAVSLHRYLEVLLKALHSEKHTQANNYSQTRLIERTDK